MKKLLTALFLTLGIVLVSGCSLNEQKTVDNSAMTEQITALQQQMSGFSSQMETLKSENEQLKQENETMKTNISSVNSGNVKLIEKNKSLKEEIEKYKSNTSSTANQESKKAVIKGTLSYPSNGIPTMKVCAVNTMSKEETCVNNSKDSYSITVNPGSYLIYSKVKDGKIKAYYTKCDTYDNKFIPECNSNANDRSVDWNHSSFICYEDNTCKSAFTPLKITVKANDNISLKRMEQGWYIPCSHDNETCNNANFDVWADYLK